MSNVLPFTTAERIEIWSAYTTERPDRLTYFLDFIDRDGRSSVGEAGSWSEAMLDALEWQRYGVRIVDKTEVP